MKNKTGIIIQARAGSTRLPQKMLLTFYEDKTILDIILQRIEKKLHFTDVVVATSTSEKDDAIVDIAKRNNVRFYRGSESDVLSRFVEAARENSFDSVIRICADNPFLSMEKLKELIEYSKKEIVDYISFKTSNDIPSIKTHFGFWTEFITLEALQRIQISTDDKLYHEHVTNYAYSHPDLFNCKFLPIEKNIEKSNLRLTVDTKEDFKNASIIYSQLIDKGVPVEPECIIPLVNEEIKNSMLQQIIGNSK